MQRIFVLLFLSCSCVFLNAQVAGDYRSFTSGLWSAAATWETYNGAAWVAAGASPTSANGAIAIQATHTVTINAAVTVDEVNINAGAFLTLTAGVLTIANGAGVDLTINGTFTESSANTPVWNAGPATWTMGANGTLIKTTNTSSNNWQSNYQGGIATIPSTSNWIIRRNTAVNIPLSSTTPASGSVYPNLTLENNVAGTWVMPAASSFTGSTAFITVKGNLDVGGAGTNNIDFTINNTNATSTQVQGNLTVKTNSFLRNNGTGIDLKGNLIMNGTISYGAANNRVLIFSGGNAQGVSGTGTLGVYNCTLNKSANSVTLNRAMTVDNLMTFTSGLINTTSVNLLTINTNGSVTGANNTSFVNGPVRYTGNAAFIFPVGKNSDYQALSYSATPGGGSFWTEPFSNGCVSACFANGWTGTNGTWVTTSTGVNGFDQNLWYIAGSECGNTPPACGSVCGATDPSLHIGSNASVLGDNGASYLAGGLGFWFPETNLRVESPTINCIGFANIVLSFNYIENGQNTIDNATVWYYDGATWSQIDDPPKTVLCGAQGTWTSRSITLPASANYNPNIKIGFNWTNNDDNVGVDPSFAVDDITLGIAAPVCDFTCEYFYANPQVVYNNVLAPTLNSIDACEYWTLIRNAGTASKSITLTWDANTCPVIPLITDTRVAHFDLTLWQDEGNGGNTGTVAAGTVTSALPVTYYGPFTIGLIPPTPLPIEMLRFDGLCTSSGVSLKWITASEHNNDYFTIERSTDGTNFYSIGNLDGAGNSTQLNSYQFNDLNPIYGSNYYRIRQTDFDGQFSLNNIIVVNTADCNSTGLVLNNAWLNNNDLEIDYQNGKGLVTIEVIGADGRLIQKIDQLPAESNYHIETSGWSSSIYFIRLTDGISSISKTIQK